MRGPDAEATARVPPPGADRGTEMARLGRVLARAGSGRPAVALIRGETGCGKTWLLDSLTERARADGWRCLAVRGVESESVLPGAALLTLLTPLRDALGSLPSTQAQALSAALGWGPPEAQGGRFLVGVGTLGVLAATSATAPVLIAVDDVQWLDRDSTDALLFAARRLGHDRVAVVMTHREGAQLPAALDDVELVVLGGLEPAAARVMLGPGFSPDVAARLVVATGGNPLALQECGRVLTRAERSGAAPLPETLPVPERLHDTYTRELAGLSAAAWRTAVLCAASTDQEAAPVLAALVAEGHDARRCLDEAREILTAGRGRLEFRHPLLRTATWVRASPAERLSAHASLAAVATDRAVRAWHRAEATPGHDAALAEELAAVADADRARRGFAAASRAGERAALLTPDPRRRGEWLAVATEDAHVAGDRDRARRLGADVLGSDAAAGSRARVLLTLGRCAWSDEPFTRARDLLEQAAGLATGRLLLRTLCELFHTCHVLDDLDGMVSSAERAAASADRSDPEQAMLATYLSGAAQVVVGRPDLGAPLLHEAIDLLETDPVLRDDPHHLLVSLLCARWLMDPLAAAGYVDRRVDRAREVGALGVLATGLSVLAMGLVWMGDHVRAHAFAGEAVELSEALGVTADLGSAYEAAATECACRGLHDEARSLLDRAGAVVARNGFDPMPPHLARVVAFCALCRGDLTEVVEVLEAQLVRFGGIGSYLEPLGVAPLLVEAYLGLGRESDAAELTARFAAAHPDPPYPQVAAMVARCQGLVATDLDDVVAAFERSLALQEDLPDRLELARTRLLLGMRLRRAGRRVDARTHLTAARREFTTMDLTWWAEQAAQELAGTGERMQPRGASSEPLTSQETRVAVLVAQGLTNREVAAALFLSPKTVEHHLSAVLRKRGLRSRTELARALAVDADTDGRMPPWPTSSSPGTSHHR